QYFNYLLNSETAYIPAMQDFERLEVNPNLAKLSHPMLNYQKELIKNSEYQSKSLRAQKTPDFVLGLSSTTIQGFGADNIEYTSGKRFNALTFGLQVPLFTQGINAQIRSSKLNQKLAENELEIKQNDMEIHYKYIYNQFTLYKEIVMKYEQTELINAHTILSLGNRQLLAGEINYLEWSMLAQQSIQTKFNYIDALT
ncbi:MAG: TolC family protein, partial [Chitinophagales bacterium]